MNTYARSGGERSGRSMDSDHGEETIGHRRRAKANKIVFSSIGEALNVVVTNENAASNVFSDLLSSKSQVNNSTVGRQIPEKLQTLAMPGEKIQKMIPGRVRDAHNSNNAQSRLRAAMFQEQSATAEQGSP